MVEARQILRRVPSDRPLTSLQHLKVQSFVLFAHSALEEYLENVGWKVALEARSALLHEGRITHALVALVASKVMDDISNRNRRRITSDLISNLEIFSAEAVTRYRSIIGNNNGITERDQKNILFPIGVDPEKTDIALMNNLNSFGRDRGNIAHSFLPIRTEVTISAINSRIDDILRDIVKFDEAACSTLQRSMPLA